MLTLTPTAIEVVRAMTSAEGMPEAAGLRIFTADDSSALQLAIAAEPAEQDQVLMAEGSRVYLDRQAAAYLDDKILDTGQDPNGEDGFLISPQHRDPLGM
ncbi:hypothetical protein [Nocardia sp. NPDC056000]|uniref:hypothetical protein n=1 Tax=Nocardia sp. NPDC056000 TaxID=3345674 RepID=UPI0035D91D2D